MYRSDEERLVYKELNSQRGADSEVKPKEAPQQHYVLHRIGYSQEDDQLLREGGQRCAIVSGSY